MLKRSLLAPASGRLSGNTSWTFLDQKPSCDATFRRLDVLARWDEDDGDRLLLDGALRAAAFWETESFHGQPVGILGISETAGTFATQSDLLVEPDLLEWRWSTCML